jgi:hypothetical protein
MVRVIALTLLLPALAAAQVPAKLAYQGRLVKADGTPQSGTLTVTFSIFDAPTGGTRLWTEDQVLAFTNGFYATVLGEVTPLPGSVFSGPERHVELVIGGNALAPRQRIVSVPYALQAQSVVRGTITAGGILEGEWSDAAPAPGSAAAAGVNVQDATASGGQARRGGSSDASGTLFLATPASPRVNGPLGAGLTRASFRLNVANNTVAGQVGTLRCGANRGGSDVDLATRAIAPADFPAGLTWKIFTLYCDFRPDDANQWVAVEFAHSITDLTIDYAQLQPVTGAGLPAGAVILFNGTACPEGWSELTAARGRVLVGLPPGGTVLGTVGAAFADRESRDHTHGVTGYSGWATITGTLGGTATGYNNTGAFVTDTSANEVYGQYHDHPVSLTSGGASAAIVPYVQLLVCQKD